MKNTEQQAAAAVGAAVISLTGVFTVISASESSVLSIIALSFFSAGVPFNLLFALLRHSTEKLNLNPGSVIFFRSFYIGWAAVFGGLCFYILSFSVFASFVFLLSAGVALGMYGYVSKLKAT